MTTLALSAREREELRLLLENALADLHREISRSTRRQPAEVLEQRRALLQAILRRFRDAGGYVPVRDARSGPSPKEDAFRTGSLQVDLAHRRVTVNARRVYLTPIEYRLLVALVKHAGQVLTHRQLLEEVWGRPHTEHTHDLHVYVGHLRRKIEVNPARPRYILTEPRVGYRLASE